MPRKPNSARVDSAQLLRSPSHQRVRSLVLGVRRNAAFLANRASTDARATTSEVDCQMKNAPRASRQDAPDLDAAETPPVPLALERLEGQRHDAVTPRLVHVQARPACP